MIPRCPFTVTWAELAMTRRCELVHGHNGPHRDGVWLFDDTGLRVPRDDDRRDRAEVTADEITGRTR